MTRGSALRLAEDVHPACRADREVDVGHIDLEGRGQERYPGDATPAGSVEVAVTFLDGNEQGLGEPVGGDRAEGDGAHDAAIDLSDHQFEGGSDLAGCDLELFFDLGLHDAWRHLGPTLRVVDPDVDVGHPE